MLMLSMRNRARSIMLEQSQIHYASEVEPDPLYYRCLEQTAPFQRAFARQSSGRRSCSPAPDLVLSKPLSLPEGLLLPRSVAFKACLPEDFLLPRSVFAQTPVLSPLPPSSIVTPTTTSWPSRALTANPRSRNPRK